jgi:hypothetical protein
MTEDREERQLAMIEMGIRFIISNQEKMMATEADLQAMLDKLVADTTAQTTVIQDAVTLITGLTSQVAALTAQIAALQAAGPGAVTQAQLDALATEATTLTTNLETNTSALAAAVPAGTSTPPGH